METKVEHGMVTAGHLGGYVAGGDPATFYPALWDWLVKVQGVRSVLDVGCGDGVALRYFRNTLGIEANGVDGIPQDDPDIVEHDYATGPDPFLLLRKYDLVWSCEFVEHVDEEHLPNVVGSFLRAPLVLLTHAEPGQPGWHHVNCRTSDYWAGVLAGYGYRLDEETTAAARTLARMNPDPNNHFARSGLAFRGWWSS